MRYPRGWRWTWLVLAGASGLLNAIVILPASAPLHAPPYTMLAFSVLIPALGAFAAGVAMSRVQTVISAVLAIGLARLLNATLPDGVLGALGILPTVAAVLVGVLAWTSLVLLGFTCAYGLRRTGGRVEAFGVAALTLTPAVAALAVGGFDVRNFASMLATLGEVMLVGVLLWAASIWLAGWVVRGLFRIPALSNNGIERTP